MECREYVKWFLVLSVDHKPMLTIKKDDHAETDIINAILMPEVGR
jgi:hypothetical protein